MPKTTGRQATAANRSTNIIEAAPPPVASPSRYFYTVTIVLSAFLLFVVQPMLAKVVMPRFGGAASVWTVALLFFQGMLVLGYTYSYLSVRFLPPWGQALLHTGLLALSLVFLPLAPWKVGGATGDPAVQILIVLLMAAGLPYFLLSTTGPLLQAWYAKSQKVAFPYRLFAFSNLGSVAALVVYPVAVEPISTAHQQLNVWSVVYGLFAAICGTSAVHFWRHNRKEATAGSGTPAATAKPLRWQDYAMWIAASGCGSALLASVTGHICQNILPMPLLWTLPLAAYLLTFILCFDRGAWRHPRYLPWLLAVGIGYMAKGAGFLHTPSSVPLEVGLYIGGLFVCCLFCHGELARRKPEPAHLTAFYLTMAVGGTLGTLLVAVLAPHTSTWLVELPESLAVCALLAAGVFCPIRWLRLGLQGVFSVALALLLCGVLRAQIDGLVMMDRSFYGSFSVVEYSIAKFLCHGPIRHGSQIMPPQYRRVPTLYYSPASGVGTVLSARTSPWRMGVIGLGTGTIAVYGREGDSITYYEIDPKISDLARTQFSYLKDSHAKINVAIGDGRLLLDREAPAQFDMLALDAFSADSVPAHLLTREAFEMYLRKLKPNGVLAVHITSMYVDLAPVLARVAEALHLNARQVDSRWDSSLGADSARWVVMSRDQATLEALTQGKGVELDRPAANVRLWTDDYSSLLHLLKK